MPDLVATDGVRLHYEERGDGSPLLIVPGWGMTIRWFSSQLDELSAHNRVIVFDPRGQGESDKTAAGQRMGRLARDLEDVIDGLGVGGRELTLMGWSLGVSTILAYVDIFGTAKLGKIVLVCGGPRLMKHDDWEHGFADLQGVIDWCNLVAADLPAAANFIVPQFFAQPPSESELGWMVEETAKGNGAGLSAIAWDVINQDYRDVLARIDRPTLVVAGRHDNAIPCANGALMAAEIPNAELREFDASGHCPFIEESERFNREVAAFVGG